MNWGKKILLVYIVFVAGIMFLVLKSSFLNQDLVQPDYYEAELKYQDKIDETERANKLSARVTTQVTGNEIQISLPPEMNSIPVKAEVMLYCSADKDKDITQNFEVTNGRIRFPIKEKNKGLHELKISWVANGQSYYQQQKLFIQ